MRWLIIPFFLLACWSWAAGATYRALPDSDGWSTLPSGLELGVFTVDPAPDIGDGRITVLRVDPARFKLELRLGADRTADRWLAEHPEPLAAINPSMYEPDGTGTAMLVANGVASNPRRSSDRAFIGWGPTGAPRLLDTTCAPIDPQAYPNLIQGIRMLGCRGENTWRPSDARWSEAALGGDRAGHLLLVFARTPWPMQEFINHVRQLPMPGAGNRVVHLQHADGGPPAQLAYRDGDTVKSLIGAYERFFPEQDLATVAPVLPNLLTVVPVGEAASPAARALTRGSEG